MRTPVTSILRQRRLAEFIAAIQADGSRADYWAEHCAWVPGYGHCPRARRKDCRDQCFFRWMRDEELAIVQRQRLQRRLRQISPLALLAFEIAYTYCRELIPVLPA